MKAKKVIAMAMVMTMGLSMTTLGVSAAEGKGTTNVSYNNQNEIPNPDPTDPTNPEWMVTIPSSIVFTDDNKEIDASVELVEKTGMPANPVSVSVESKNAYNLQLTDSSDPVSYTLSYASKLMSATETKVADLTATSPKQEGTAKLTGKATKAGVHTDVLTYTVSYTK